MAVRDAFTDAIVDGLLDPGTEGFVYVPSTHVAPGIPLLLDDPVSIKDRFTKAMEALS